MADHRDQKGEKEGGRPSGAEGEPALGDGFGQKVSDGGAEGTGQDESQPEQRHVRHRRHGAQREEQREQAGDEQGARGVAEARAVRQKVAHRGAQRVRHQDRRPEQAFAAERVDAADREGQAGELPDGEDSQQQGDKHRRAGGISETKALRTPSQRPSTPVEISRAGVAVHEVGHRRAGHAGGQNDRPVAERVIATGNQLGGQGHHEQRKKGGGRKKVPESQRLREEIAGGLAECRRGDLHDPERGGDMRKPPVSRTRPDFGAQAARGYRNRHMNHSPVNVTREGGCVPGCPFRVVAAP